MRNRVTPEVRDILYTTRVKAWVLGSSCMCVLRATSGNPFVCSSPRAATNIVTAVKCCGVCLAPSATVCIAGITPLKCRTCGPAKGAVFRRVRKIAESDYQRSSCPAVLSVRMKRLGTQWTDFDETLIFKTFFKKYVEKI